MINKRIIGTIIIAVGLFFILVAFGSENCLPLQEDQCLLRRDGDFIVGLVLGLASVVFGIILAMKKKAD